VRQSLIGLCNRNSVFCARYELHLYITRCFISEFMGQAVNRQPSPRRLAFDHGLLRVTFMVSIVAVGWGFLRVLRFSAVIVIPPTPHIYFRHRITTKRTKGDACVASRNANAVSAIGDALDSKRTYTFFCHPSKVTSISELCATGLADQLCRSCCCNGDLTVGYFSFLTACV
jgi:hypothetical protein